VTEPKMAFWKPKKLAKEFGMSQNSVSRLLKSIGAKKWSGGEHGGTAMWYWDPQEVEKR